MQGNNPGGGAADRSPYSSDFFRVSFLDSNDLSTWTDGVVLATLTVTSLCYVYAGAIGLVDVEGAM